MPISVVVGGQFGSEGKGKVAHHLARRYKTPIAVRVGGPNSGHTVIDAVGETRKFRSLPTASILANSISVIAAGSYILPQVVLAEINETQLDPSRLLIDPSALLITDEHLKSELSSNLGNTVGSTLSGTGAAVISRLLRDGSARFVGSDQRLAPFVRDTRSYLRGMLRNNERVIIEGTQGFGLSALHSQDYPFVTARDTTAAGFVSEVGLSPLDVDDVIMVVRAFPIRVAGASGPLPNEIDWRTIKQESGYREEVAEYTTVTGRLRRIARFDAAVVRKAIEANAPTTIVLNHLDYIDVRCRSSLQMSEKVERFVDTIEAEIDCKIDLVGFGPSAIIPRTINVGAVNEIVNAC